MVFVHQARAAFILITLTIVLQSAGIAVLIQWIKDHFPRHTPAEQIPFCAACREIHNSTCLLAHDRDSFMDGVLSLQMFLDLGVCVLFLRRELFAHAGARKRWYSLTLVEPSSSPAGLARASLYKFWGLNAAHSHKMPINVAEFRLQCAPRGAYGRALRRSFSWGI